MKTSFSVKASTLAITILMIVSALWHPTIVKAQSLKSLKASFMNTHKINIKNMNNAPENLEKLEVKPINSLLKSNVNTLKIEIDVEELTQIKIARKKALELGSKKKSYRRSKSKRKSSSRCKSQRTYFQKRQ